MFRQGFYQPQTLITLQQQHKYTNHPELYLNREIVVTERQLMKQVLYMISGLETELFVKAYDEVEFDSEKGEVERIFNFTLREDCRTVFTHLTEQAIKSCTDAPVKIANMIHYLSSKSRYLYQKTSNIVLRSFAEGVLAFISRLTLDFTKLLTSLQKDKGNISCESVREEEYSKLTLLKINYIFQQKVPFLTEIIGTMSKILPYMARQPVASTQIDSNMDYSPTDSYMAIQILFDQFSRLMSSIHMSKAQQSEILLIYENSLLMYLKFIQNWIEMNPYLLQAQKGIPFFIKLSEINFSLSKISIGQRQGQLRSNAYTSLMQRQQSHQSEQFVEFFFRLDNLLVAEYLPQMFKKKGQLILQLGKIIQFIYLYYSTEQKPLLEEYFSVKKEFQQLNQLIKVTSRHDRAEPERQASTFLNQEIRRRKPVSISERLGQQKPINMKFIQIEQENPYEMFPATRGVFVDYKFDKAIPKTSNLEVINNQQEFQHLYSATKDQINTKKNTNLLYEYSENFEFKFQRILSSIIQRLYQKSLLFLQQKTSTQFFSLSSHLQLSEKNYLKQTNFSQLSQQNIPPFQLISPMQFSVLEKLQNQERIISSISLTLIGIKKFMLYQQGDFFLELITSISNIFQSSCTKISRNTINSYIDEAIKSSSANALPEKIKEKVSFIFLKKSKNPQIKSLKVWSVFSILFRPEFPVNCIFNCEIMHNFGEIFNFIFNIKKCEHLLKGIWQDFKQNAKIQTQYSLFQTKKHPFQSRILAIRNNIHHFINVIFGWVMISIQSMWQEYTKQINLSFSNRVEPEQSIDQKRNSKIHNPISLIELTQKLQQNLKLQTIQNLSLSNTMILISELLSKFKKLLLVQPDSKQWNDVMFKQQIDYIGHEFMGIMEIAKNIEGVGEAIFYNSQI